MNKKLVILGAGESGVGAALLGKQQGYDVWVSDRGTIGTNYKKELEEAGIAHEENAHDEEIILSATEIIKSPGIPDTAAIIKKIKAANISIISEIEFAYRYKGDSKIIAITGSNGKTTTTSMIYHILSKSNYDVAMVGNIGYSFARQLTISTKEYYVIEISSFQLDDIETFKPDVSIITNITEDHLDRYDHDIQNYINSKFRITMNQDNDDVFIYNLDDETTTNNIQKFNIKATLAPFTMNKEISQGAYLTNAELHIKWKGEEMQMSVEDFALKGRHNLANGLSASLAGVAVGLRKEKIRDAMHTVESLEHRTETVATIRGMEFINDSKATNVNSTWFALENMHKPTVLILGGIDKGNNYATLIELAKEKVKAIICLGVDNEKIHQAFNGLVPVIVDTITMIDAVNMAYSLGEKGDVVLLSPACASFDLFKSYEDRGSQFKAAVKNL